jgi:transcriptional regulator with XRE-family HTH domain
MTVATRHRLPALEALRVNVIVGRAQARLSQEQLAQRAGVSRPTISRIERSAADVRVGVVQRIADALGVSVADLFDPEIDGNVDDITDDELAARLAEGPEAFLEAGAFLDALDEAAGRKIERYSRAGRPAFDRPSPSTSAEDAGETWR